MLSLYQVQVTIHCGGERQMVGGGDGKARRE